jgi:hypothetical protein
MDSLGSLCDKIGSCNNKLFLAQETLYVIRKMSLDEFKKTYGTDEGLEILHTCFKKSMDLNVQRSALILEFDKRLVELVQTIVAGKDVVENGLVADQHKTY